MKHINWSFIKVILLLSLSIFLWSFTNNRYQHRNLENIKVKIDHANGNQFVNQKVVDEIIGSTHPDYPNMALDKVFIRDMELELKSYPFIEEAEVYKYHNGNLFTDIKQVNPVIRVNDGKSEYYITEKGKRVPLSPNYSSKVILLSGKIDSLDYIQISDLAKKIKSKNLLSTYIIGLKKKEEQSYIIFTIDSGYIIDFGGLDNMEEKLDKLEVFYKEFIQKYPNHPYKRFKLNFKNQIVAVRNGK